MLTLPQLSNVRFDVTTQALERWKPLAYSSQADVIELYDIIGEYGNTLAEVSKKLSEMNGRDVTVRINSAGGSFFEGVGIYNALKQYEGNVTVQIMGLAASAASLIAMAADNIEMSDVGFFMIHNAWAVTVGNRHDLRAAAEVLEPFDDSMADVYAKRMKKDKKYAQELMDAETWLNASQSVEFGLADTVNETVDDDIVEEDRSVVAIRKIDAILAKHGLPRSERRMLLNEVKKTNTQDAVCSATQDASEFISQLINTLKVRDQYVNRHQDSC